MNGGRSQSRGRHGRDRSSSGFKNVAATGALAAAGKEAYDRFSRSRSRHRGRAASADSYDDEERESKRRSKSVSEYISRGMAALGLGEEGEERGRDRGDRDDRYGGRRHRREPRYDEYSDSDADSDYDSRDTRHGRGSREVGSSHLASNGRNPTPHAPTSAPRGENGTPRPSECDSDLGDSSDEQRKRKKMKRDMLLTSGLATVATVHAAHGLYNGVQKRKKRMKQLEEGEITPEEARKARIKANTMDAVSVGLAALGVKGAYMEWKEVDEKRKETKHFQEVCERRAMQRELRRSKSQGALGRRRAHRWPDEIESNDSVGNGFGYGGVSYHDGNADGLLEAPQISY